MLVIMVSYCRFILQDTLILALSKITIVGHTFRFNILVKAFVVGCLASIGLIIYCNFFVNYPNIVESDHTGEMATTKELFLIKPSVKATASVIFLHGLGDNGAGWYHAFDGFKRNHVRYIFPNAPAMPVTLNGGFVMPSWYDLKGLDPNVPEDEKGIKSAAEKIRALIKKEQEEHGIPSNKVILGGFSMGGALALYTALTHPEQLGGIVLLSSWLPLHKSFDKGEGSHSLVNQRCPILQCHGEADPMVPLQFGQLTQQKLKAGRGPLGLKTEFKTYRGMGHQSCDEEMDEVKQFIEKIVAPDNSSSTSNKHVL
ncbi:acyl-protein thioesterase 1-like isoform X1 [Clavelina lepadiformis]|uniref:acyl-protein thioesterase 1-like isoform X1 n=1 Tax=Clavelina lepadiformis TaxID=159417 RepID=UPI004041193F